MVLAPHAAELVCAAGGCDRIVGVVDYTDFPARLKNLPHIGRYDSFDIAGILHLKPTLIIGWESGNPPALLNRLRQLGLPVWLSHPVRLMDIPTEIETLGQLLGTKETAHRTAGILRRQLKALRQQFDHPPRPTVFYEIWDQPLITPGGKQFISQAVRWCGGRNLFADVSTPSVTVSLEAVLRRAPQVILLGGNEERQTRWKQRWQAWPQLPAVQHGWIFPMPADLLQRPGPRLIAGTAVLCHALERVRQALAQSQNTPDQVSHPPIHPDSGSQTD